LGQTNEVLQPADEEDDVRQFPLPRLQENLRTGRPCDLQTEGQMNEHLERGEEVNLATEVLRENKITHKGVLKLAQGILRMDEELRRLYERLDDRA
jgi:hypothetical protein